MAARLQTATAKAKTLAHADPVHHPAHDQVAYGIGQRESVDDGAEVAFRPMKLLGQIRAQDAEDLAIDVVDRRGEEQQAADHPAVMRAFCLRAGGDGGTPGGIVRQSFCWFHALTFSLLAATGTLGRAKE